MKKIKEFLCNIPLYLAFPVRLLSDKLFLLSFRLHITFNTDAGVKIKNLEDSIKKLKELVETPEQPKSNKVTSNGYSKLANIIKGKNDGST